MSENKRNFKDEILVVRTDSKFVDMICNFINAFKGDNLVFMSREQLGKEYWMDQLQHSNAWYFEGKSMAETREILEKEWSLCTENEYFFGELPGFEDWCGYTPSFYYEDEDEK